MYNAEILVKLGELLEDLQCHLVRDVGVHVLGEEVHQPSHEGNVDLAIERGASVVGHVEQLSLGLGSEGKDGRGEDIWGEDGEEEYSASFDRGSKAFGLGACGVHLLVDEGLEAGEAGVGEERNVLCREVRDRKANAGRRRNVGDIEEEKRDRRRCPSGPRPRQRPRWRAGPSRGDSSASPSPEERSEEEAKGVGKGTSSSSPLLFFFFFLSLSLTLGLEDLGEE